MSKLRHLKTTVQHVFILDDGEEMQELVSSPIEVSAADFPTYPSKQFVEAFEALRAQHEQPEPNRAARRAKPAKPTR